MRKLGLLILTGLLALTAQAQPEPQGPPPPGEGGPRRPMMPFVTETPMVHDPVMAYEDSTYHIFSTGLGIQHLTSKDRKEWRVEMNPVMSVIPKWATDSVPDFRDHIWAPDIIRLNNRWYMAYSCSSFGVNTSAIGLISTERLGDRSVWQDEGPIVISQKTDKFNAIDPNFIVDELTQTAYMTFGSFWDGIQLVKLDSTLHVAEDCAPKTIARRYAPGCKTAPENPTSKYAGRNAIEAPFIVYQDGYYYLFVSWDYCCRGEKSNYRVAVGRSTSVEGPYLDDKGVDMLQGGGKLILEGNSKEFNGVGHCAVYGDLFLCHGYSVNHKGAAILVQKQIDWSSGWPELK